MNELAIDYSDEVKKCRHRRVSYCIYYTDSECMIEGHNILSISIVAAYQ